MAKNNPEEITSAIVVGTEQEVTVIKKSAKSVAFYALEDIDAWVGGTHYQLRKDKEHKVPEDVAAILTNSHKGYRR